MTKRLVAKVGEYQDREGNSKGRYVEIGVILSNDNGEYAILDPAVNLAGVLTQQNMMNHAKGGKPRDKVMVSIFANDRQNGGGSGGAHGNQQGGGADQSRSGFDDEIPF